MRYDKYDPISGGFRAVLEDDMDAADTPVAVGLTTTGTVEPGASNTGIIGVICLTRDMVAGSVVDVMTAGEGVQFDGTAGTVYTANTTTGVISDDPEADDQVKIGWTVEADRLVVRVGNVIPATVVVGDQAAIADIATADGSDAATTQALANAIKAKVNTLLAELRTAGLLSV